MTTGKQPQPSLLLGQKRKPPRRFTTTWRDAWRLVTLFFCGIDPPDTPTRVSLRGFDGASFTVDDYTEPGHRACDVLYVASTTSATPNHVLPRRFCKEDLDGASTLVGSDGEDEPRNDKPVSSPSSFLAHSGISSGTRTISYLRGH